MSSTLDNISVTGGDAGATRATDLYVKSLMVLMETTSPLPSVSDLIARPGWQARAACRGRGPADFFPAGGSDSIAARLICRSCPVSEECLAYALSHPGLKGIWGGTSERHRDRLRAEQRSEQRAEQPHVVRQSSRGVRNGSGRTTATRRRQSGPIPMRSGRGGTARRGPAGTPTQRRSAAPSPRRH